MTREQLEQAVFIVLMSNQLPMKDTDKFIALCKEAIGTAKYVAEFLAKEIK